MGLPDWSNPRNQNPIIQRIENEYIPISPDTHQPEIDTDGPWLLEPHQVRILNAAFSPTWSENKGIYVPRWSTYVYSCCKKSGKTAIAAAIAHAFAREYGGEILFVANDEKQSMKRAFDRIQLYLDWLERNDKDAYGELVEKRDMRQIIYRNPYACLRAIPCDPGGEAGGFQSLTVWDELWNYRGDVAHKLWAELQPIPNIPVSIRIVVTYAGHYGSAELLYSLYEQAVRPDPNNNDDPTGKRIPGLEDLPVFEAGDMFVYWDHEARMPWHTTEFLEAARNDPAMKVMPHEYLRLWENRWTTGLQYFIDIQKVDASMREGDRLGLRNNMEVY